jgi:hypothetical protein
MPAELDSRTVVHQVLLVDVRPVQQLRLAVFTGEQEGLERGHGRAA